MAEKDPLDGLEPPTLAEQIETYRKYGDAELAVTLLTFAKCYGGCGLSSPAKQGFDIWCPTCEENVRTVTKPGGPVCTCPLCGNQPGLLVLGSGPKPWRNA
jgi:hypothetical protein